MKTLKEKQQGTDSEKQMKLFELPESVQTIPPDDDAMVNRKPKYSPGKLFKVTGDEITVGSDRPRKHFEPEHIASLAESIRKSGIIQPILCTRDQEGHLVLAAGELRLKAAIVAELTQIPVIVVTGDAFEISLIENVIRQDLTAVEEAEAIYELKERNGYSLDEMIPIVGKERSTLSEIFKVARLPLAIRDDCRGDSSIPRDILVHIARLSTEEEMTTAYREFKNGKLSREELKAKSKKASGRESIRQLKSNPARLIRGFSKGFSKIDIATLNEHERKSLSNEVEKLVASLMKTLDVLRAGSPESPPDNMS